MLKIIGIKMIREKRGIQWDRSQIRVWAVPILLFFSSVELYSDLNNIALLKCLNY
jgi:hypothetical protein